MTEMLKQWYPPPITIGLISDEDLVRLIDYFASFGIQFHLTVLEESRAKVVSNRDYLKKSQLEQMTFQMSWEQKRYTIRFSNI